MIGLLMVLIVAAILLWAVGKILPLLNLPEPVGTIVYVIVIVIIVFWLVQQLGGVAWPGIYRTPVR